VRPDGSAALETAVWSWSVRLKEEPEAVVLVDLISAVHLGDGCVSLRVRDSLRAAGLWTAAGVKPV
jgi:hypothetical protein